MKSVPSTKKVAKRKRLPKIRPIFGWVGVVGNEMDLDPDENGFGLIYVVKKAAASRYERVVRVVVKVY